MAPKDDLKLTENEINTLLRFSDILCRSKRGEHKNLSLKIISLLLELEDVNQLEYFQIFATNTLVKLGIFPSLEIIRDYKNYLKIDEIRNDYIFKTLVQNSPLDKVFTDAQYHLFEKLKQAEYYSFSGSTSFGKSFIFEAFTKYLINQPNQIHNIAFIVPTKALINQVSDKLKKIIDNKSDYKIVTTPIIPKVFLNSGNKYVFIFTAERMISYFTEEKNPKINYLFVDEAHKLLNRNDTRTPLLYHVLWLAKKEKINIYFASPNISNADIFLKIINSDSKESTFITETPVTQNQFFIDTVNDTSFMISDYGDDIHFPKFYFGKDKIENLKTVLKIFSKDKQSIIYCNTTWKTINTCVNFANKMPKINSEKIEKLIKLIDEKVHSQYYLKKCLRKGIAYHFSGIPEEIKIQIETLYKQKIIKFLFCTSTLLEGINLPAKNIFILSEKIGNQKMNSIDFWNLAGRAGRLAKDMSGNVFCVNLYDEKGYWKEINQRSIFRNKKIEEIKPQILSQKNDNLYQNISNYFEGRDYTNKNLSERKIKIVEIYGNILLFHNLVGDDSILKNKFIDVISKKDKNKVSILEKMKTILKITPEILARSITINFNYQNKIVSSKNLRSFPKTTNWPDCCTVLNILYDEYEWETTESKGLDKMIMTKKQINYYATLMYYWIQSKSLKFIIDRTIKFYEKNHKKIYITTNDGKKEPVNFNSNDDQLVNELINSVIDGIENTLKFKIKNYIANYESLLRNKNRSDINLNTWENYIEYGTTDLTLIEIQNFGFSRNVAIFLKNNYFDAFKKNNNGTICDVDSEYLKKNVDREKYQSEYDELSSFFNWNRVETE